MSGLVKGLSTGSLTSAAASAGKAGLLKVAADAGLSALGFGDDDHDKKRRRKQKDDDGSLVSTLATVGVAAAAVGLLGKYLLDADHRRADLGDRLRDAGGDLVGRLQTLTGGESSARPTPDQPAAESPAPPSGNAPGQ